MLLAEILNPAVTMPHHGENRLTRARTPAMIPGMFTLPMLVFVKKPISARSPKGLISFSPARLAYLRLLYPVASDEA